MRARAQSPLLLTVFGLATIGSLAAYRLFWLEHGLGRVLGLLSFGTYLAWLGWESQISVRELGKDEASHDRGTMEMCAAAKLLTLLSAFAGGGQIRPSFTIVGLILMLSGILLRASSIRLLGNAYSHRIRQADPLHDDGPYRLLRHPAYLGTLVAHAGFVLVFLNAYSLTALLLLWTPAVVIRTVVEDRFLLGTPDYRAYASRVRSRLLPGIW
ncbi:MAG: isoprenylcysteine carboxylmethyltransferase family protein [Deltaproteobacteria bacterium]|nr:isoprenylcysteine carboxylmethyltransferase family protein [Deltaproteobacteria bacterium]